MKKTIITLLAGTTLLLTSCGDVFEGGWNINNSEGIKELKTEFLENFDGEKEVNEFAITAKDHMTSEFGKAKIKYLTDGVAYEQSYKDNINSGKTLEDEAKISNAFQTDFFIKQMKGKVKIKDLDFASIATKFNEACTTIPAEFENFTLYNWTFEANKKDEITSSFTIEASKKGEGTSVQGRNIVTNYYEFNFGVNKEGELEIKD